MTPSQAAECYQVPNQDPWCGIHGSEDWSTCAVKRKEMETAIAAKDAEIQRLRGALRNSEGGLHLAFARLLELGPYDWRSSYVFKALIVTRLALEGGEK